MSYSIPELLAFACSVMSYDCSTVPVPSVIHEPLYQMYGAFGVYQPERGAVIVIDSQMVPYLDATYTQSIVIHELTHYIDYVLRGMEMFNDLCGAEARGWQVGNEWLSQHERAHLADYMWQVRYNCP